MREIILDTETTGLDAKAGDRLIEIGCVEINNLIPTGQSFHVYVNPQRPVSPGAQAVHGISDAFLSDKPIFADIADAFEQFIGADRLVIHNASFDLQFINAELARLNRRALSQERVLDTLALARRKHPAGPNSLDALCQRYGIDNARRTKHGALLDAEILAEVYIELMGGRQVGLSFTEARHDVRHDGAARREFLVKRPVPWVASCHASDVAESDRSAHGVFVSDMGPKAVWRRYLDAPDEAD